MVMNEWGTVLVISILVLADNSFSCIKIQVEFDHVAYKGVGGSG